MVSVSKRRANAGVELAVAPACLWDIGIEAQNGVDIA